MPFQYERLRYSSSIELGGPGIEMQGDAQMRIMGESPTPRDENDERQGDDEAEEANCGPREAIQLRVEKWTPSD
jgi:hypothetical protein